VAWTGVFVQRLRGLTALIERLFVSTEHAEGSVRLRESPPTFAMVAVIDEGSASRKSFV
jgi:hypothetical protein